MGKDLFGQRAGDTPTPPIEPEFVPMDQASPSMRPIHSDPNRQSVRQQEASFQGRTDRQGEAMHDMRIISAQEQQQAFILAQRHTRRVKWLKWGVPLMAIGIIAGFVSWVAQQKTVVQPEAVVAVETTFQQDELVMQNPNLNGFSDGRAYEVVAKRAIQKVATPDVINLEDLSARIADEQDQWVTITSKSGLFNQKEEQLSLNGTVDVKSSLGYNLITDVVDIEMKKGYMQTQTPVEILSNDIRLKANKLEAFNNGEQFRFVGKVQLRIDAALINKGKDVAPEPDADPDKETSEEANQ